MNRPTIILSALASLLLCASCSKASLETTYNNQETKIEAFINSQVEKADSMRVVHHNGSHRAIITEGEGEELGNKGTIAFYYAGYVFTSGTPSTSNLFATNHEETATAAKWTLDDSQKEVVTTSLTDKELINGLLNGLIGVRQGEVCWILFSGKYGFGKKLFGTIPANSALCYKVWVESISND